MFLISIGKLFLLTFSLLFFSSCGQDLEMQNSSVIYMWLSTTASNGDLGGVNGADSICETDAPGIGLPGNTSFTHSAVIAATSYHPRDIIPANDTRSITRIDRTIIASRYSDFFDSSVNISNAISATNRGYWSGLSNAANISPSNCLDWTNGTTTEQALVGAADQTDRGRYSNRIRQCRTGGGTQVAVLCISY